MIETMVKKIKSGRGERYSFGKVEEYCPTPNLLEIQRDAYKKFLETGIDEVLQEFSPVVSLQNQSYLPLTLIAFSGHIS